MHKILALTRVFLKNSFQNNMYSEKKKSKGMIIVTIFALIYLAGIVGFMSHGMISMLMTIKQEKAFLGIILLGIGMFVLIQTIFSAINILYFSKDNEYILPLPIKPYEIVIAKTNVMLLTEYIIIAMIGLVPLIIYGYLTGSNLLFYIMTILVCLIFPILPILISGLIGMIIMSFSKFMKDKNRFQLIATTFSIVLVMIFVFFTSGGNGKLNDEQILQFIMKANSLVEMLQGYFPTLGSAIEALDTANILTSILGLLKLVGITLIIYIGYIWIAKKLYLKGAVGNLESGKKVNKKLNEEKAFKGGKLWKSYAGKEWKTLLRNPIFLMQCILPTILFPIIILGIIGLQVFSKPSQELNQISKEIAGNDSTIIVLIILGIIQFISMFSYIAPTAISRDGANATFMKYIPVPFIKQIYYKILPAILLQTVTSIIIILLISYLTKINILIIVMTIIVCVIMIILQNLLMIIVDLKKPKLEWTSEYAVVKQNINLIWPTIFGMINIVMYIGIGTLVTNLNVPVYVTLILLTTLYIVLAMLVKKYIINFKYIL